MNAWSDEVLQAAQTLARGELIGLPTETVYGLAADALNPAAVNAIFKTKGRSNGHDPLANFEATHITNSNGRQTGCLNFHESHIRSLVRSDNFCFEFSFIRQSNQDLVGPF
ncbi:MAG: hypothetical protein EBR42_06165, partial [Betaproteobacteria bacterium]|nr:hypothetical protein [Betaproteobacteria bacterium]